MTGTLTPITAAEPQPNESRQRSQRGRLVWPAIAIVIGAAAGIGSWLLGSGASRDPSRGETGPIATAVVERGTISATESWDGTIEYAAPFTVNASVAGVITRLADQGKIVEPGDELYRVNEEPVILLRGVVPMYRDLAPGSSGLDVEQLETNLVEMGYDGFTVDDDYTWGTAEAVSAWQDDTGARRTGTVARGTVVFVPGGSRVDALRVGVSAATVPGAPVLDITATEQVVRLEVALDDRDLVDVDTGVTVVLPDGGEISGAVGTTAVVPRASEDSGEGTTTEPEPIVDVEIILAEQVADDLVGAPVDVVVAIEERADVLLVPVNALLALAEGGYGLEIVKDDGTTSIVSVTTGLFADGKVQVEGDGIADGTVVGVAGR